MHEHKICLHKNLKHCSKCDVIYCEDCKREWGKEDYTYLDTIPYSFNDGGTH